MRSLLVALAPLLLIPLPRLHLVGLGLVHAYHLVAVEQTHWVKGLLHLAHQIDRRLADFVGEIVALNQANAVLALCLVLVYLMSVGSGE